MRLRAGRRRYSTASDRLYHTTSEQFYRGALRRSAGCCGWTRSPRPRNCGIYYPDNYWFAPDQSAASRMEEAYRRLVLRDHVQFVAQALRRSHGARVRCSTWAAAADCSWA